MLCSLGISFHCTIPFLPFVIEQHFDESVVVGENELGVIAHGDTYAVCAIPLAFRDAINTN